MGLPFSKIIQNETTYMVTDSTARAAIEVINNNLKGISGVGECVFIGDSLGEGIINALEGWGFTVTYSSCVGGAGFKEDGYITQMNTLYANVSNPENVKYVIAIGGTNDTLGEMDTSIITKTLNFCVRARELFPNARIMIGYCATLYRPEDYARRVNKSFCKYCYIRGVLDSITNAEFIDGLTETVANLRWLFAAGEQIHPNSYGYMNIAAVLIQHVVKQELNIAHPELFNDYTVTNTTNGISCSTHIIYKNDGSDIAFIDIPAQTIAAGVNPTDGVYTLIPYNELPMIPIHNWKQLVHIDGEHAAYLELSTSGLRMFSGGSRATITGATDLQIIESLHIPVNIL